MTTTKVLALFFVCAVLLNPVLGVGRLFVDEITGYTNEDVTAANVRTDLLVVDEFTNENAVSAIGGSDSHWVDTPGKIFFNAGLLNFTASDSIDIMSLGESVGLSASLVELYSRSGDISMDGVDASFVAGDITGTIDGTFSTYGTDAELRSVFDMTFLAGDDFFLDAAERIQITSNEAFVHGQTVSVASAESNIFVESLLGLNVDGSFVSVIADSGLELGSSHGDATLSAVNSINVQAENFIYTAETNTFNIENSLSFETQSIAGDIFMYTERTYITVPEGDFTMQSTSISGQTAILSSGSIESTSDTFTASATDILLASVDTTSINSRTDITIESDFDMNFLASGGFDFAASNVLLDTLDGNIDLDVFGKSYFTSVSADLLINAGTDFNFNSGSTSISSTSSMELNSDNFIVNGDFVDFYSDKDILVTAPSFIANVQAGGFMDSHESSVFRSRSVNFESNSHFQVVSLGDVSFQNSDDFTNSAVDLEYDIADHALFSSFDAEFEIRFDFNWNTDEELKFSSGGQFNMDFSDEISKQARDEYLIANNNLNINNLGDFTVISPGENSIYAFSVDIDATTFVFQSSSGITLTTNDIAASADSLDVNGGNILISAVDDINVSGANSLTWDSPSTFVYMPSNLVSNIATTITGTIGNHFSSSFRHGDTLLIEADSLTDTHNAVSLNGGTVDVEVGATQFGVPFPNSPIVTFSVDGEQDFVLDTNDGIDMEIENDAIIRGSHFVSSSDFFKFDTLEELFFIHDEFTINASDDIDFDIDELDFTFESGLVHADGNIVIFASENADFETEIILDFGSRDSIDFNSFNLNVVSRDTHLYAETLDVLSDFIAFSAGFRFEAFFDEITHTASSSYQLSGLELDSYAVDYTLLSGNNLQITTDDLSVNGGSVAFTAAVFNLDTDVFTLGTTRSTPANINLENTVMDFDSSFTLNAGDDVSFIATGSEAFEQEGIRMVSGDFTLDALSISVEAYKGVSINTPVLTASATDDVTFATTKGAMISFARQSDITFTSTLFDTSFTSNGGMTLQAYDRVSSSSDSASLTATKEINLFSQDNDINLDAVTALNFSGNAFTLVAGLDEELESDILFNVGGDSIFTFASYARFEALGNQLPGQSNEQISIIGGDTLARLSAAEQVSFYPSGEFTLDAELDSSITASSGSLSFGSASNLFSFDSNGGIVSFDSAEDFSVKAGGVFGQIFVDIDTDFILTVTGAIHGSSNGTTVIDSDFHTVNAAVDINFTANNAKSKIHGIGNDITFTTTDDPALSNIDIIGRNSEIIAGDVASFIAPVIDIGAGTPRISTNATNIEMISIGDININTVSDLLRYDADLSTTLLSTDTIMQSGGDTTVEIGNLLQFSSDNIALTAGNSVVVSAFDGAVTHDPITLQSTGTGSGQGMVMTSTDQTGSIEFAAGNNLIHTITNDYVMNAFTGTYDGLDITTSSRTLNVDSDFDILFETTFGGDFSFMTTGNTAKIAVLTQGANGDINFDVNVITAISGSDFNSIASGSNTQIAETFTLAATGANSGKINMDASNDITLQADASITSTIVGDIDFNANGEDSLITISGSGIGYTTSNSISISTGVSEGGSIFVRSDSQTTDYTFNANDWSLDIDGDVSVDTLGDFTFTSTAGNFELASFGYGNVHADIGDVEFTSVNGDIYYEAENAAVVLAAEDTLSVNSVGDFTAMVNSVDFVLSSNETAVAADSVFIVRSGDVINVEEVDGDITVSAYSSLTSNTGYARFDSAATSGDGISITTSYPGGDFSSIGESEFIIGNDISMIATGSAPESGYVKIIADRDGQYDPNYWGYANPVVPPSVSISSAAETQVRSDTGDIRFEYASQLLIDAVDINGVIGGAMEVNVRGDGRTITSVAYNDGLTDLISPAAISIHDVSGVQFITERGGSINFEAGAGNVNVQTVVTSLRSDDNNLYLESSGTVSFIGHRDDLQDFGPEINSGVNMVSTGDIEMEAHDGDIAMTARDFVFANPNVGGTFQIEAEGTSVLNMITDLDDIFMRANDLFITNNFFGDINLSTSLPFSNFDVIADDIDIIAGNNIYLIYTDDLIIDATNLVFETNTLGYVDQSETFMDEDNFIRLSGYTSLVDPAAEANVRPTITMPQRVRFDNEAGETNIEVSQGTWCEVNRQIGYGETNQGGYYGDDVFCVCIDHVWACIYNEPFSRYYYDPYNNRIPGAVPAPVRGYGAGP